MKDILFLLFKNKNTLRPRPPCRKGWGGGRRLVSVVAFTKAFNLATPINLLTHYAKGTPSFIKINFDCL